LGNADVGKISHYVRFMVFFNFAIISFRIMKSGLYVLHLRDQSIDTYEFMSKTTIDHSQSCGNCDSNCGLRPLKNLKNEESDTPTAGVSHPIYFTYLVVYRPTSPSARNPSNFPILGISTTNRPLSWRRYTLNGPNNSNSTHLTTYLNCKCDDAGAHPWTWHIRSNLKLHTSWLRLRSF
jgi:hypothetical protein